ncbi:MAG: DUF5060 domain-containing protein [Verrucomicrobiota bacterium]
MVQPKSLFRPTVTAFVTVFLLLLSLAAIRAQTITDIILVNADTDSDIEALSNGFVINLAEIGDQINLRADVTTEPGSISFALSGAEYFENTENRFPFALKGDASGDYLVWRPSTGDYTVTIEAFSLEEGGGEMLDSRTISFSIINQTTTPFVLLVDKGVGSGDYRVGSEVIIAASPAPEGHKFRRWEGDVDGIKNVWHSKTTLLMPEKDIAIKATYRKIPGTVEVSGVLEQWHKVTVDLIGPESSESASPNPFMDFRYQVLFTGPSGQQFDVPGFFAGNGIGGAQGDVWRAFFSPNESGEWQYQISFRKGPEVAIALDAEAGEAVEPFDAIEGTFSVEKSSAEAPDFRASERGLLINRGGHYLTFSNGVPFFYAGTGIPENILGYRGFDNTTLGIGHEFKVHEKDYREGDPDWTNDTGENGKALIGAINYLSEQGNNTLYFLPMNLGGDGKDTFPMISPTEKTRYDLSKLAQWEIFFDYAQSKGQFLNVLLAETEHENEYFWDNGEKNLGPERRLFYRMVNALMGHHNGIKYVISEEVSYPKDLRDEYMAFLKEPTINPYDHPVTFHTGNETNPHSYLEHLGNQHLDTTSTQANYNDERMFDYVQELRAKSAKAGEPWVAHFDEPQKIENDNEDYKHGYPLGRRSKMWPFFMGGGSGFSWYIQKDGGGHGFDQRIEDFTIMKNALNWSRIARNFFESLPVQKMQASKSLATSSKGGTTLAFFQPGEIYTVYNTANGGPLEIDLQGVDGEFSVEWFNPRTGDYLAGDVAQVAGGKTTPLGSAPKEKDQDWAVVLKRLSPATESKK